jgi:putative phosphoribosyl transferase
MRFENRTKAGKQLADKLEQFLSSQPEFKNKSNLLVVGLPRGGVPVALEVARKFSCPLEIIVAKKLPFPGQPEYAIGAVSSGGVVVLNRDIPDNEQWQAYIQQQRHTLLKRNISIERQFYELAGYQKSSFKDKTVIIVDDGIATGMTAMAALETARRRGASHTIIAAPVMSSDSYHKLSSHSDAVIALSVPADFASVGQYYINFDQTSDEEVVNVLREGARLSLPQAREPRLKVIGI